MCVRCASMLRLRRESPTRREWILNRKDRGRIVSMSHKPGNRPDLELQRQSCVTLERRRRGKLRIGCLSWGQPFRDAARWLSASELARSLDLVSQRRTIDADLILCSGALIMDDGTKLPSITNAASATPVLAEWRDNDGDPAEWWLATASGWEKVRQNQYVFTAAGAKGQAAARTLAELENDWGVIRFHGINVALVLLICGEARILCRDSTLSIVAPALRRGRTAPTVFNEPWALLHPSHRPALRGNIRTGWGLYARTTRKSVVSPGLFESLTDAHTARPDGTQPPRAIFHSGPWEPGNPAQESISVCAFQAGNRLQNPTVSTNGLVPIRYAEFDL